MILQIRHEIKPSAGRTRRIKALLPKRLAEHSYQQTSKAVLH